MASRTRPTTQSPPLPAGLTREQLLEIYRYLRLTRTLEERLTALYRQSKVIGGLFRSLGQEGESVGSAYALARGPNQDILSPLIRNLGSMLVMGAEPIAILRQYMAKAEGPTRGRGLNGVTACSSSRSRRTVARATPSMTISTTCPRKSSTGGPRQTTRSTAT